MGRDAIPVAGSLYPNIGRPTNRVIRLTVLSALDIELHRHYGCGTIDPDSSLGFRDGERGSLARDYGKELSLVAQDAALAGIDEAVRKNRRKQAGVASEQTCRVLTFALEYLRCVVSRV